MQIINKYEIDLKSKKRPLVSIVIPAYNHANYIGETIDSVMGQIYENIELIVINDGSPDDTDKVIREYLNKYENKFTYIYKKNEGLIKTLNLGLKIINGKYYQAVASDDILYKDKIEIQVKYLEKNKDYGMVYSDCIRFYEKFKTKIKASSLYKFRSGEIFDLIYSDSFSIPALSVLIRTNLIREIGYEEKCQVEDWILWCRLSYRTKIGYVNRPLSMYRLHNENMHKNNNFMKKEKRKAIKIIKTEIKINGNLKKISQNNRKFRESRNYKNGIFVCKQIFLESILKKIKKEMTVGINRNDIIKFLFKWR